MPGRTHSPPVPCGPYRLLWPVKHTTSAPMPDAENAHAPAVCAASRMNSAPTLWAAAAMRSMSYTSPVTLEACVTATKLAPTSARS